SPLTRPPGSYAASSTSSRAHASATRPAESMRRSLIGGMNRAGSKPWLVDAQCEWHGAVSNVVTGAMPEAPDFTASMNAWWPRPKQEIQPMPEITARSRMRRVPYHAVLLHSTLLAVLALPLPLVTVAAGPQASASTDLFTQIFNRTSARRAFMRSVRARFTETTVSTLLEKPIVAHGTIIAAPPARVLMTYTDPERRTVALDSKSLIVVWPDRNERDTIDISKMQRRIDQYFTQASVDQLRSMFDITADPDVTMREVDRVS